MLGKEGVGVEATDFVFFATDVNQLSDQRRHFTLSREEVELVNPNSRTCAVFRTSEDCMLTKNIYKRVPIFAKNPGHKASGDDEWGFEYMTKMFDMADNSGEFIDASDVRVSIGSTERGPISGETMSPVYEAKYLWLYDYHHFSGELRGPRYWIKNERVEERLRSKHWEQNWLMGWRGVTNATNERSVICSFFPRYAAAHSIRVLLVRRPASMCSLLVGCLSSLALDYVARQKIGGVNLTVEVLSQLPVLPPCRFSRSDAH